jgi:lipooligosaccharide transport system permease protein
MITNLVADSAGAIAERRANRPGAAIYSGRSRVVVQRGYLAMKSSNWFVILSGFVEPVFYLLAFGFGIGQLIGGVTDGNGNPVSYAAYIAPALLATSAMNGAIYDATWNVFWRMHFGKQYQATLATSMGPLDLALGEMAWALLRGLVYAIGFMVVSLALGLVISPFALLAIPAALLIAFGFAAVGMAVTSYMESHTQMSWISFFLLPMFLFSGTFYPVSVFPQWIQTIVNALPLAQAVNLVRGLMLGNISIELLVPVIYFIVMVIFGLIFTTKRLTALFMR